MACKYCESETSVFADAFVYDAVECCKWCPHDKCINYDDDCDGVGFTDVPVNFCPSCGAELKKQ